VNLNPDPIYPDDIFLVSYPRSGNTWIRYMLSFLKAAGEDVDQEKTLMLVPDMYIMRLPPGRNWAAVQRPRMIKSHEPYPLYPDTPYPRAVYLVRDGRDVACSYFDFLRRLDGYKGSFPTFLREFLEPSFDFASWPRHVVSWLSHASPAILVVKYEDLLADTFKEMARICDFAKQPYTREALVRAIECSTRDKIARDSKRPRIGLGEGVGAWRRFFDTDDLALFREIAGDAMRKAGYEI